MSKITGTFTIEINSRFKTIDAAKRFSRSMQSYIKFVNKSVLPVITEFGGLFGVVRWTGDVERLADPASFLRALDRNLLSYFEAYKVKIDIKFIEEGD